MKAQKHQTGRNYIGLLHEETWGAACRRHIGGREAPYHGSHYRPDDRNVQPPQRSEL